MNKLKSHFKFNKQERSGIFFLLLIIVFLQVAYFLIRESNAVGERDSFSLDVEVQSQIEVLKQNALQTDTFKIYPFNPNYVTDYKGYTLGMSVDEIDRLHAFRAQNKFANSPEEFQKATGVSDSLLEVLSPYFKFPEWSRKNKKRSSVIGKQYEFNKSPNLTNSAAEEGLKVADLNTATAEDLKQINGIGEKLSARIVKFRDRLGGFLIDEQLYDVYGLEPEVVERALRKFRVLNQPEIGKININTASAEDISKLEYIQKHVAQRIVDYRNDNGSIDSFDDLQKIEDFPSEKIDRIALYLSL